MQRHVKCKFQKKRLLLHEESEVYVTDLFENLKQIQNKKADKVQIKM